MGSGVSPVLKSSKNQKSINDRIWEKVEQLDIHIRVRIILIKPHGKLVPLGLTRYRAYTCGLSNL